MAKIELELTKVYEGRENSDPNYFSIEKYNMICLSYWEDNFLPILKYVIYNYLLKISQKNISTTRNTNRDYWKIIIQFPNPKNLLLLNLILFLICISY
jgi:hypothetical protein